MMSKVSYVFSLGLIFCGLAFGQLRVKNSTTEIFTVTTAGNVGIGKTNPTSRLEVPVASITTLPYSYGNNGSVYTNIFANGASAPSTQWHYVNAATVSALSSDNGSIHLAFHGTVTHNNDQAASGVLGYHNTYGSTDMLAGVHGQILANKPYSTIGRTAAGDFLQANSGTHDYGISVDGKSLFSSSSASGFNGLIYLGIDQNISISRSTANSRLYIANDIGDIDLICTNIRMNGTVIHNSDRRLKNEIQPMQSSLDRILTLEAVSYLWGAEKTNTDDRKHFGLIAQDAETVIPELVVTDADGYKAINYIELIPFLIHGMQEQQQLIEQLQSQLESLKNEK